MADRMKAPPLYPCSNRINVPHVGDTKTRFRKRHKTTSSIPSYTKETANSVGINKQYLKQISSDLSFSEDVVRDRCFHLLPYDEKYLYEALDISDIVAPKPKTKGPVGRYDNRAADTKHLPCHIKKRTTHQLEPLKRNILQKALELHRDAVKNQNKAKLKSQSSDQLKSAEDAFLTEVKQENEQAEDESEHGWDESVLTMVSSTTARWIVSHRTSPGEKQQKLASTVTQFHGEADKDDKADLVKDNVSEGDSSEKADAEEEKKWKKQDETLLDRVREMTLQTGLHTDPYDDNNTAAFYRLPAGFRRAQKYQEKEEAGAINTTAYNVHVTPFVPPPPPTLRDHMNPAVGKYIYDTDNVFQQERLTGAQQIYNPLDDIDKITTEYNNKYRKKFQTQTPRLPKNWYPLTDKEQKRLKQDAHKVKKLDKGVHRWKALPEPIDDTAEKLSLTLPGTGTLLSMSSNPESRKQARSNSTLVQIVNDWRGKWHLDMRYADATPEDLIRDMADMHPHIRLKAITTCARAAEYRAPPQPGIQLDDPGKQEDPVKLLPEELFIALECCMDDEHEQVRRAAAIALYTLERPVERAEEIMRKTLKEAKSVDRWTAAQCLAYYGECDSEVVGELVAQMLNTEDSIRYERAAHLLARLSENSTLVHCMLGEQLNSSSWRHRVMVCKVLPKMHGQINRDLVNKLTYLMWNDWHVEVRKAAAHTLGKTGHGRNVHDELREKIRTGNERMRAEAVQKVGHLGIMTAKLLPAFLECFTDSYVSVRMEACTACSILRIRDPQVLDKLVFVATYDAIWRVKALAFQAMGSIGIITEPIRNCILWALRYEDQPGVRAEACHTSVKLEIKDPDLAQILQDRFLVESSPVVKYEITKAFEMFGISPTEDMDMVAQIKNEVRKLCTKNRICNEITVKENADDRKANMERMIAHPIPMEPAVEKSPPMYRRPIVHRIPAVDNSKQGTPNTETCLSRDGISREGTALTPTADKEIQFIMERQDTNYTTDSPVESRSQSGYSKSVRTLTSNSTEVENESNMGKENVKSEDSEENRDETRATQKETDSGRSKELDHEKGDVSEHSDKGSDTKEDIGSKRSTPANSVASVEGRGSIGSRGEPSENDSESRRTPIFEQSDQYVEVSNDTEPGEDDKVVHVQHSSPEPENE